MASTAGGPGRRRARCAVGAHRRQRALATLPKRPWWRRIRWPIKHEPDVRAAAGRPGAISPGCARRCRSSSPRVEPAGVSASGTPGTAASPPDRYGIPTPVAGEPVTPMCCWSRWWPSTPAISRIGYGGGYFSIARWRRLPRPAAGRSPSASATRATGSPASGRQAHDQRLDWIVTENWAPSGRAA